MVPDGPPGDISLPPMVPDGPPGEPVELPVLDPSTRNNTLLLSSILSLSYVQ